MNVRKPISDTVEKVLEAREKESSRAVTLTGNVYHDDVTMVEYVRTVIDNEVILRSELGVKNKSQLIYVLLWILRILHKSLGNRLGLYLATIYRIARLEKDEKKIEKLVKHMFREAIGNVETIGIEGKIISAILRVANPDELSRLAMLDNVEVIAHELKELICNRDVKFFDLYEIDGETIRTILRALIRIEEKVDKLLRDRNKDSANLSKCDS